LAIFCYAGNMKKSRIISFIIVIVIILSLAHFVLYAGLLIVFPELEQFAFLMEMLVVVLPCLFIASIITTSYFDNIFSRFFYTSMAAWIGLLLYPFLASLILAFLTFVVDDIRMVGITLLTLAVLTFIYGLIHARQIKVFETEIKLPGLPDSWKNKRVVFVSDFHVGQIQGKTLATKVVRIIKKINPNIIFIGGDLYDGHKVDKVGIIEPLKELIPELGIYFVTGNHDGFSEVDTIEDVMAVKKLGIHVLENQMTEVDGVQILGVDYRDTVDGDSLRRILSGMHIDKQKPSILLKHVPDHVDVVADAGISLMLCGHTHRAQVWPLRWVPRMVYKGFEYGLKKLKDTQIFTSSGVGTWGPPMRVGTDSEIVVINFT